MMLIQCQFLSKAHRLKPLISIRQISSSKDHQKASAVTQEQTASTSTNTPSNWISYGFDRRNKKTDRTILHLSLFGGVTLGLVLVGYGIMYSPDVNQKQWAQREAFLELRRREAARLPLIDRNLIDPSKIELPSDEELGKDEIII